MAQELQRLMAQFKVDGNGNEIHVNKASNASTAQPGGATSIAAEISSAINAHARWYFHLQEAIKKGTSEFRPETVRVDDACQFGKWMYSHLEGTMRGSPLYESIKELHAKFHDETAKVLSLALHGKKDEALRLIGSESEFKLLSGRLVGALTELKNSSGTEGRSNQTDAKRLALVR